MELLIITIIFLVLLYKYGDKLPVKYDDEQDEHIKQYKKNRKQYIEENNYVYGLPWRKNNIKRRRWE
jgi:hypothetical protein